VLEEYYKILRSGSSAEAFRDLGDAGLLQHISPQVPSPLTDGLQASLDALDTYRRRFVNAPESLTNPVLLGSLLVPLGLMHRRPRRRDESEEEHVRSLPQLGQLPLARKDVERLAHALSLQPRLLDTRAPERRQHGVVRRPSFRDALTWMEVHGQAPDVVAYWREMAAGAQAHRSHAPGPHRDTATADVLPGDVPRRRRRRRRRGRGRGPRDDGE
jgi:hypothetical protein